jgi:hypothetical protein
MSRSPTGRLVDLASVAEADVLKNLECPKCAGGLKVQFAPSQKMQGAGTLSVMCAACMWRVVADGVPSEPPWVRELGPKVQTRIGTEPVS